MKPVQAVYVYCVTRGQPVAADEGLHPFRPVYSVVHEELVGVVSPVPLEEFGEEALHARLEDADWLEREVRAHEQVIERVMAGRPPFGPEGPQGPEGSGDPESRFIGTRGRTVLPMKFCTIFHTEQRVRAMLQRDQATLRRALDRLRGREEWQVKLYREPPAPLETSPDEPAAGRQGTSYLMRKAALERAAQEAAAEARRQAQRTLAALAERVEQIQLKPVASQGPPGSLRLALDAVCLLSQSRLAAFHRELDEIARGLTGSGLRLRLTGPWPPYHFSTEPPEDVVVP